MKRRKILIGTPLKAGISDKFLGGFLDILAKKSPEIDLDHCFHSGTSVNFARNEICFYARKIKAREIVWIDEDMEFSAHNWARLISHIDLDIVGCLYPKKKPGRSSWNVNLQAGQEIDPVTGLCEVEEIGTGFMKVRVDTVLEKMAKEYPEREYYVKHQAVEIDPHPAERGTAHEFFPMGSLGPRSPGARLDRIKMILERHHPEIDRLAAIHAACYDEQPPGNLFGEDYYFCRTARAIGFKIHADFGAPPVGHRGGITFPITRDMIDPDLNYSPAEAE